MKIFTSSSKLWFGALVAVAALSVAVGCGGGGGYGGGGTMVGGRGNPSPSPAVSPSPSPSSAMPTVHINFFGAANGSIVSAVFGTVSGFTQRQHAQVLGLAPGTQVVLTNNDTVAHTFNVYSGAYPALNNVNTNANPNGGVLGAGYQSGPLQPGASTAVLTVTNTTGNLFIVCGFHYGMGMQDGLVVQVGASPGPQATPAPSPSGGCHGYGC